VRSSERGLVAVSAGAVGIGASLGFFPGFLATVLSEELLVSKGKVGLIVGIYFGSTGLGSILTGKITEKIGPRAAIAIDMAIVAICSFSIAIVGTYIIWVISSILAGAAYGLSNTGTNVAIGKEVDKDKRTFSMSIKTAGVPFMAALASAIGPWSASQWKWEHILLVNGIVAIAVGISALFVIPNLKVNSVQKSNARTLPTNFFWFGIAAFLLIAGSQPLYSWIVSYLEDSMDASSGLAGGITSIACFSGVVMMICNGLFADRLGPRNRINLLIALLSISTIAVFFVSLGPSLGMFFVITGATIGVSTQLSAIGTMHACIVDKAPFSISKATGITMTGYYLGALASPPLFGFIVDWTGTFAYSWIGTGALLFAAIFAWQRVGKINPQE
jgi:MFS family permease|tara:strand:+ start:95442 stop:96605 length:1164 start_codon:yes stop_codon:yes gene_type:complete